VRAEEVTQAFGLIRLALSDFPERTPLTPRVPCEPGDGRTVGWAEAPQGEVLAPRYESLGCCAVCARTWRRPAGRKFAWAAGATGPGAAALTRGELVPQVAETDETVAAVRGPLAARTAARLGPVYDVHRLGIFFTASPRHADVLLVTGAGSDGMVAPQRATYATCRIPRS